MNPPSHNSGNYIERRGAGPAPVGHPMPPQANQVIAPAMRPSPVIARNMMRRQSDRGFNLATVLGLLFRRRLTVAAVFALLFVPVVGYVSTRQPKYDAELKLILKKAAAPGVASNAGPAGVSDVDVQAEIELLKSKQLYEESARQTGLIGTRTTPKDAALKVAEVESALKIAQVGKTNIISVRYTNGNPETAAAIPNALAELYLRKHIDLHSTDEAARFFADQTAIYQRQLDAAQRALTQFRQTGDVTLLQEQKQAYLRRATDLEAAIQESESALRDAEQRMSIFERQRSQLPATVETGNRVAHNSATVEKLKSLLIDLNNKRTELVTKYDPNYRLVKEVDRQIADTRAALDRESQPQVVDQTNAPNPLRQGLESELLRTQSLTAGLRARRSTLVQDLADYRSRQIRLEKATANHNDLERAVKIAEENFLMYQRKLEEARLAEALDKQRLLSVAILEKAAVPALAASQHRTYFLLFGFLAAAFLAFASAFVADYLERHMPTRESLAAAAPAPVPAALPEFGPGPEAEPERPALPDIVQRITQALPSQVQAKAQIQASAAEGSPDNLAALVNALPQSAYRPPAASPPVAPPVERRRTPDPGPSITLTRQEIDGKSGNVTTTAVVLRKEEAWRELFDRRSREAARTRQKQATTKSGPNKIDADFLRRVQDKKTNGRDYRTGTRG